MPEIEELENLLRQLLQGVQDVMQSGEVLSDEFQGQLAQTLQLLSERIDSARELQSVEQQQAQIADQISPQVEQLSALLPKEPIPELDAAPHESSNINAFKYDPSSQKLIVRFQDKYPGTNGPVYSYDGVPNNIFEVFRRGAVAPRTSGSNAWHTWKEGVTPSHGAAMYALIREGGYPYQRLS